MEINMTHDKAYYEAEKEIEQALKSGAPKFPIRYPFICFTK